MLYWKFLLVIFFLNMPVSLLKGENPPSLHQAQTLPQEIYQVKDFSYLLGMPGFSDDLLKMHFTLYSGYVKNTNLLIQLLRDYTLKGKARDYPYQSLKRRFGWEFDGMRLHELYFENLGGKKILDSSTSLYKRIVKDFHSFDIWKEDFIATGMMRGIGWVILYFDPKTQHLFNVWINEHDLGHLAGGDLLLVMDVWEHAFMPQFGLDRAKYIEVFFSNINWEEVSKRFQKADIKQQ